MATNENNETMTPGVSGDMIPGTTGSTVTTNEMITPGGMSSSSATLLEQTAVTTTATTNTQEPHGLMTHVGISYPMMHDMNAQYAAGCCMPASGPYSYLNHVTTGGPYDMYSGYAMAGMMPMAQMSGCHQMDQFNGRQMTVGIEDPNRHSNRTFAPSITRSTFGTSFGTTDDRRRQNLVTNPSITRSSGVNTDDAQQTTGADAHESTIRKMNSRFERLQNKVAIERFDPSTDTPAEMWLACFEQVTEGCTDYERVTLLLSYVSKDAFRWYAQFVTPFRSIQTWPTVRRMFLEKFARRQLNPAIAAARRKLTARDTIQSYFDDQTRDMELARFTEQTMIEFLTDGLPDGYRQVLYAREPRCLAEWLRCAQSYERSKATAGNPAVMKTADSRPNAESRLPYESKGTTARYSDEPPKDPCPRCKRHGKTEYHWSRTCSYPRFEPKTNEDNKSNNETAPTRHLNSRGGPHAV